MDVSGTVQGVFAYFFGTADPTYAAIEGHWLNDAPCGVIHVEDGTPRTAYQRCG